MTNDVAVIENQALVEFDPSLGYEALAAAVGLNVNGDLTIIPRLRINYDTEDDTGVRLPAGSFMVHNDTRGWVYASKVIFKPFFVRYQYVHYDGEEEKFVNKSIQVKGLGRNAEEPVDELGGVRCGKPTKKMRDAGLTGEQAKLDKAVQVYRKVYGTVTFVDGKTKDGEPIEVVDFPVVFNMRGANFMSFDAFLKSCEKSRKLPFNFLTILTTRREKKGKVVYYVVQVETDRSANPQWTVMDNDTAKEFWDSIEAENRAVRKKHEKASRARPTAIDRADAELAREVSGEALDADFVEVPSDLDDEIPF